MKKEVLKIIKEYLTIFPNEKEKQLNLIGFLEKYNDNDIIDWNNFDGHLVASGFIYAKKEKKFLVIFHNDLSLFLSPGGHIEKRDKNILEGAKREIFEETGLKNIDEIKVTDNELIPIDIDCHFVKYNKRLELPQHYHFDFRYLFTINNISEIKLDTNEISTYKWIDIDELRTDFNFGQIIEKMKQLLKI